MRMKLTNFDHHVDSTAATRIHNQLPHASVVCTSCTSLYYWPPQRSRLCVSGLSSADSLISKRLTRWSNERYSASSRFQPPNQLPNWLESTYFTWVQATNDQSMINHSRVISVKDHFRIVFHDKFCSPKKLIGDLQFSVMITEILSIQKCTSGYRCAVKLRDRLSRLRDRSLRVPHVRCVQTNKL